MFFATIDMNGFIKFLLSSDQSMSLLSRASRSHTCFGLLGASPIPSPPHQVFVGDSSFLPTCTPNSFLRYRFFVSPPPRPVSWRLLVLPLLSALATASVLPSFLTFLPFNVDLTLSNFWSHFLLIPLPFWPTIAASFLHVYPTPFLAIIFAFSSSLMASARPSPWCLLQTFGGSFLLSFGFIYLLIWFIFLWLKWFFWYVSPVWPTSSCVPTWLPYSFLR